MIVYIIHIFFFFQIELMFRIKLDLYDKVGLILSHIHIHINVQHVLICRNICYI